ncbi:tyrosine-type recombinase/integrase, partial [Kitasatospora sp. NPDC001119]
PVHRYLHFLFSLIALLVTATKESEVDLRQELMEGRAQLPCAGSVAETGKAHPPYSVLSGLGVEVEPVTAYLRDLALSDSSPLTARSYGYGMLRWFRLLWLLDVAWEQATEAEAAVLTGWLRTAPNPQRRRRNPQSPAPGAINARTGKPYLAAGYAPTTINHALSVVSGFYTFHAHYGRGPVLNPVPVAPQRRRALSHLSPLEPKPVLGRARLRQKVSSRPPRSIPDPLWDELFAAMGCDRDRALLDCYVTSGARAEELLGVGTADVHWAKPGVYVVSKGTRERELVPISPEACVRVAHYLDGTGVPRSGEPLWRTRHGADRPLSYWAMRRVLQRAQQALGTNWTLHDLRHTAAHRMANSGKLTLPEVQAVLRHANIQTTSRYLAVRVEEIFDALLEHYNRPRPQISYPTGYAADDIAAVFGV